MLNSVVNMDDFRIAGGALGRRCCVVVMVAADRWSTACKTRWTSEAHPAQTHVHADLQPEASMRRTAD